MELDVILDANLGDQIELRLDEVHMILLSLEDLAEQVTADKITDTFTMGDRLAQHRQRALLELKIAFQDLPNIFADQ